VQRPKSLIIFPASEIRDDGSTISGDYEGAYTLLSDGRIRFDVHVRWLKGTGRLKHVTGEADVVAFLQGLTRGAEFVYVTNGTLTLPDRHKGQ
jgi:hypothetical protein